MARGAQDRARWSCGAQGGAVSLKVGRGQRVFRAQEVQPRQCLPDTARPAGLGSGGTEPWRGQAGAAQEAAQALVLMPSRWGEPRPSSPAAPRPGRLAQAVIGSHQEVPSPRMTPPDLGLAPRSCEDSPTPKQLVRPWSEALDGPGATAPSARPHAAVFP